MTNMFRKDVQPKLVNKKTEIEIKRRKQYHYMSSRKATIHKTQYQVLAYTKYFFT